MSSDKFAFGLGSSEAIWHQARELVAHLNKELMLDQSGKDWTQASFAALRSFLPKELGLQSFFREAAVDGKKAVNEFLWDFIAYKQGEGIFLAAESEQDHKNICDLRHDFEKLLYVRAPLKLMVFKADTLVDAAVIAKDLGEFAASTCQHFDPGSVLMLYCRTLKQIEERNIAFIWRSSSEPNPIFSEPLLFAVMSVA